MTTIDIISGFLGAGKTTLIKKLLEESFKGQNLVLIENEFGEIGIDGGFLKESGIRINEMTSGCICCSLVGDFDRALHQVVDEYHPDRILIEPSGVGKLSDVSRAVGNAARTTPMQLGAAVTVVNAKKCKLYMKNFGEFFNDQIEAAGVIVLSRTQDISEDKLEEAVALLRQHNPQAAIITTPWDQLTGDTILSSINHHSLAEELISEMKASSAPLEDDACELEEGPHHDHDHAHDHHHDHEHEHGHHDHDEHEEGGHDHHHHDHHHHHADEVFQSWGAETPKKFSKDQIRSILQTLEDGSYGTILRAKGFVADAQDPSAWIHFDMTPGEIEIRPGAADYTGRVCVIGANLQDQGLPALFGL